MLIYVEVFSSHLDLRKVQEKDMNFELQAFTLCDYGERSWSDNTEKKANRKQSSINVLKVKELKCVIKLKKSGNPSHS